jgi:uncharacterized protein YdeI (YjbR/CyaY-like superfamily)
MNAIKPRFFRNADALRKWLEKNHDRQAELWVGMYKKSSGRPSVSWPEVVDQALCFGWIDGIRKSIDDESYMNRITPRRKGSNWSAINIRRVQELTEQGLMTAAGARAFAERDVKKSQQYSFEQKNVDMPAQYLEQMKRNRKAWAFWQAQPPFYRRTITWWVTSAKQEETRQRRLQRLITDSAAGERVGILKKKKE